MKEVSLTTIEGRQVLTQRLDGHLQYSLDLNGLPAGTYLLSVTTEEEVLTERLIVRP